MDSSSAMTLIMYILRLISGADPGFQVRGGGLKKIAPSGGGREHFWGISCEKSRFYANKLYFFQFYGGGGGGGGGGAPWIRPGSITSETY